MKSQKKISRKLSQESINKINLFIALLALIFSLPSVLNQLRELKSGLEISRTEVIHFSPPPEALNSKYLTGEACWGSIASDRSDAARCATTNNLIIDPCFLIEQYKDFDNKYYYCPVSWVKNLKDQVVKVSDKNTESGLGIRSASASASISEPIPWMIVLSDNNTCRLHTGTVGIAYGENGTLYSCANGVVVTTDRVDHDKYIFSCKYNSKSYYEKCIAKTVVF